MKIRGSLPWWIRAAKPQKSFPTKEAWTVSEQGRGKRRQRSAVERVVAEQAGTPTLPALFLTQVGILARVCGAACASSEFRWRGVFRDVHATGPLPLRVPEDVFLWRLAVFYCSMVLLLMAVVCTRAALRIDGSSGRLRCVMIARHVVASWLVCLCAATALASAMLVSYAFSSACYALRWCALCPA